MERTAKQSTGFRFADYLTEEARQRLAKIAKGKITIDIGNKKASGISFISRFNPAKHDIIFIIVRDRLSGKLGLHIEGEGLAGNWTIVK